MGARLHGLRWCNNFRSNVNITTQSNFGTQEGVNWAVPLWNEIGLGAQLGIGVTQSNFQRLDFPFDESRKQTLLWCLFHRPACIRVFNTAWRSIGCTMSSMNVFEAGEVRGEIAYQFNSRDEIGFACAVGVKDDQATNQFLSPADFKFWINTPFTIAGDSAAAVMHAFGVLRWAVPTNNGSSNSDAGLVGVDFNVPISRCWAFEGGFNYVVASNDQRSSTDETWNLGMNLVWYIGGNAVCRSQYRPLFNVADNGSMFTRVTHAGN